MERGMSGINEHNEARRRELVYFRRAVFQRKKEQEALGAGNYESCSSCRQMPRDPHSPTMVDQQRRDEVKRQQNEGYSAKMKNRYTSTDYISQW